MDSLLNMSESGIKTLIQKPRSSKRLLLKMGLRCDGVDVGVMGRRRPLEAIMGAAGKAEAEAANLGVANEVLNERAVEVMQRLSDKLTGRDATAMGQQGADSGDLSVAKMHSNTHPAARFLTS